MSWSRIGHGNSGKTNRRSRSGQRTGLRWFGGVILLLALAVPLFTRLPVDTPEPSGSVESGSLRAAFESKHSNVFLTTRGKVVRVLSDDLKGARHQRFVLRSGEGLTVLVSHNIDVAGRVPLSAGTLMEIRGEYLWNEEGGLLHWTHGDPRGLTAGGWIKLTETGQVYR